MTSTTTPTADLVAASTAEATTSYLPNGYPDLPSYIHPDLHLPLLVGVNIGGLVLATICLALRLYVRRFMIRSVQLDDYILIAAYFFFAILTIWLVAVAAYVASHDATEVIWIAVEAFEFWDFFFSLSTVLLRIAIALFFLRALPPTYLFHRHLIIALTIFFTLFTTTAALIGLLQCGSPLHLSTGAGHCLPRNRIVALSLATRLVVLLTSWALTLLPIHVVLTSRLPARDKISALAVVLLAALGSVICVLRIPYNHLGQITGPNELYEYFLFFVLALAQNTVDVIAVSLAGCRPLVERVFGGRKEEVPTTGQGSPPATPESGMEAFNGGRDGRAKNVVFLSEFEVKPESP